MGHGLLKECLMERHKRKDLSGIFERTTVLLDSVNAFTGTKPVTKANLLSIFNLLLQKVGGTKASWGAWGSRSIPNKRHLFHPQFSLVFWLLLI